MKKVIPLDEEVLWTLRKDARTAEARIGTVSIGGGQPELRLYTTREDQATFGMLFCQVTKDTRVAKALAEEKKREFVAQGWR